MVYILTYRELMEFVKKTGDVTIELNTDGGDLMDMVYSGPGIYCTLMFAPAEVRFLIEYMQIILPEIERCARDSEDFEFSFKNHEWHDFKRKFKNRLEDIASEGHPIRLKI